MKCILLCAGYARRLLPLTKHVPKALLEIEEDRPLLNYIIDKVNEVDEIDHIYLVTNEHYVDAFTTWASTLQNSKPISVLNDHTTSYQDRMGAIGDIGYVLNRANITDDIIVIASDNLFTYDLRDVLAYYKEKQAPIVCAKEIDDVEVLKNLGVAGLDDQDQIIDLVEKPSTPASNIGLYATYIYPKHLLNRIRLYLEEGNNPDAPGYLVEYLYKRMPVYAYRFHEDCFDVGNLKTLEEVRTLYRKKHQK